MNAPRSFLSTLCFVGLASSAGHAQTLRLVPEQYASISAAMASAVDGDTISVAPGSYYERVSFAGKSVVLVSRAGAKHTLIDAALSGFGPTVRLDTGSNASTVLDGFTLKGGYASDGGGIQTAYSSPTVRNCVITNNKAQYYGGGVSCQGGSPRFENCVIADNEATDNGAIVLGWAVVAAVFDGCTITRNRSGYVGAPAGAGFYAVRDWSSGGSLLRNSILWGDDVVGTSWHEEGGFAFFEYCTYDLHGLSWPPPGPGMSNADPQFVDAANGDYRLRFGSPCVDAGDPAATLTRDIDGRARPIDGNLDTAERSDMGALEMAPLELVTTGAIGTPLRLELRGPTGAPIQVLFSRRAPVSPQATPWGEFDLDPAQYGPFFNSVAGGEPPTVYQRTIPPSPALIGRTFSFQGLVASPAAPQGFAYTNVVTFTITP